MTLPKFLKNYPNLRGQKERKHRYKIQTYLLCFYSDKENTACKTILVGFQGFGFYKSFGNYLIPITFRGAHAKNYLLIQYFIILPGNHQYGRHTHKSRRTRKIQFRCYPTPAGNRISAEGI